MNLMAESIALLKKNVEKNENVLEKVQKQLEQTNLRVNHQVSNLVNENDRKFEEYGIP